MKKQKRIAKLEKILDAVISVYNDDNLAPLILTLTETNYGGKIWENKLTELRKTSDMGRVIDEIMERTKFAISHSLFKLEYSKYNPFTTIGKVVIQKYCALNLPKRKRLIELRKIPKEGIQEDSLNGKKETLVCKFIGFPLIEKSINRYNLSLEEGVSLSGRIDISEYVVRCMEWLEKNADYDLNSALSIVQDIANTQELPLWVTNNQLKILTAKKEMRELKILRYYSHIESKIGKIEELTNKAIEIIAKNSQVIVNSLEEVECKDPTEKFFIMYGSALQYLERVYSRMTTKPPTKTQSHLETEIGWLCWYVKHDFKQAEKMLLSAIGIDANNYTATSNLARIYEELGESNKSEEMLRETAKRGLPQILALHKQEIGTSNNSVFTIDLTEFKGLIFKELSGEGKGEPEKIEAISRNNRLNGYTRQIGIVSDGAKRYAVIAKANPSKERLDPLDLARDSAITFSEGLQYLENLLNTQDLSNELSWWDNGEILRLCKIEYCKRAIRSIAQLQKDCKDMPKTEIFPEYDYAGTLEEKVLKRLNLEPDIVEKAKKAAQRLDSMPRGIVHGDMHLGNLIDAGKGETCLIDFESASYANRFFDLAYFLEQAELNLPEEDKKELIDYFVTTSKEKGEVLNENPYQAYQLNAVFINLRIAGAYSRESKELHRENADELMKIYITKAEQAIEKLELNGNLL